MIQCPQCNTANNDGTRFCSNCGAALTGTVSVSKSPHEEVDPLLGKTIEGKYRFDDKLGEGGMGAVYKATRLLIGDTVAVKVLHQSYAGTAQAGERFRREAQAAARFKHPNSVAIYDFGVTPDGLLYLIMELAEGSSLRKMIHEQGALPLPQCAEIMKQVCSALDEAHKHNIVHRDMKPDNVMVKMTGTGPQVKVLDFGIAKLKDLSGPDTLTQHGAVIGTPHYMSPEQCLGEELDGRSDIYSLGIVLYEMLSGAVPFNGPTSREIISKQISAPLPPIRSIRPELPDLIEGLLKQTLEKEKESRPQTASVLALALGNALKEVEKNPQTGRPSPIPGTIVSPPPPQRQTPPGQFTPVPTPQPQQRPTPQSVTPLPQHPTPPGAMPQYNTMPPQPVKQRGFFGPFAIGCIVAALLAIGFFIFLIILGSMAPTETPSNSSPETTAPAVATAPTSTSVETMATPLPDSSQPEPQSSAVQSPPQPASVTDAMKDSGLFRGTINDRIGIEMRLERTGAQLSGVYKYTKVGQLIQLRGNVDNDGRFLMQGFDQNGKHIDDFNGDFISEDEIEGTWSNPDGSKVMPLKLSRVR